MTGSGDTRLLNPDGWTRWWNPAEFPQDGTMFGYKDGLLGAPDSTGNFNSTLNGYKYYSDSLNATSDYLTSTPASRGLFSAGTKNIRRFELELGTAGLVFNYAVDACWVFPNGDPPFTAPDDFPPEANRAEAWGCQVTELDNSLYNDGLGAVGGDLSLQVDVYDHFNAGMNVVTVESPGNFAAVQALTPSGGGIGFSTYQVDITDATPGVGSIGLLITVESELTDYQGLLPGKAQSAYFTHTSTVSSSLPANPVTGNVMLQTTRSSNIVNGLLVSWTSNGSPEYAVYADMNPYDGLGTFTNLVGTTTLSQLTGQYKLVERLCWQRRVCIHCAGKDGRW